MSLRDFYMERMNLSNDPRFRAQMRGSSCYAVKEVGPNSAIIVMTYKEECGNDGTFDEDDLKVIADWCQRRGMNNKLVRVNEGTEEKPEWSWDLDSWTFLVPVEVQVCGLCNGSGKTVDPRIDAGGLTCEDFDRDPEFREDYFSGRYDITCPGCQGQNVVRHPDLGRLPKPLSDYIWTWEQNLDADLAERMAEFRFGC